MSQESKELAKAFAIQFAGEARIAAQRAAMLLGTMSDPEGVWHQRNAVTLAGELVRVEPDDAALRRLMFAFGALAPADKRARRCWR